MAFKVVLVCVFFNFGEKKVSFKSVSSFPGNVFGTYSILQFGDQNFGIFLCLQV